MGINVVARFGELRGRIIPVRLKNSIMYVTIGAHDNEQHTPLAKPQKLEMSKHTCTPWRHYNAGKTGQAG